MLQRGHTGGRCDLASTFCKYDLRKGNLFVLSWARVRRVRRESISSDLLTCGGGERSILLLPLEARCIKTICLIYVVVSMTHKLSIYLSIYISFYLSIYLSVYMLCKYGTW